MHRRRQLKLISAAAIAFLAAGFALPARSQYSYPFGYSPLSGSNSWLWLSRSIFNPGRFLYGGSYSAPYYLLGSLAYSGAYAVGQGVRSQSRLNSVTQNWSNPANGVNAPAVDQIAPASWYKAPDRLLSPPAAPAVLLPATDPLAGNGSGPFMPVPANPNKSGQVAESAGLLSNELPAPAPDFRANARSESRENQGQLSSVGEALSGNLFAQAFVDHVNEKYAGDIKKALSDRQTRSYASALGVMDRDAKEPDLPAERVDLIKRILQDKDEDALSKVNTLRLLIKHH